MADTGEGSAAGVTDTYSPASLLASMKAQIDGRRKRISRKHHAKVVTIMTARKLKIAEARKRANLAAAKYHGRALPISNDPKSLRGWSAATYAQIVPDRKPLELFADLFASQGPPKRKTPSPDMLEMAPYPLRVVLHLLSLFPDMPPHLDDGDYVEALSKSAKTNGLSFLDENHLYGLIGDPKASNYWMERRAEEIEALEELLDQVAKDNIDKVDFNLTREKLANNPTTIRLLHHQHKLTVVGFRQFTSMIMSRYDAAWDRAMRAQKHEIDPVYFHPRDRLIESGHEESVALQMKTFTEGNGGSWSVRDLDDPSIVYTQEGGYCLEEADLEPGADEQRQLEFPALPPRLGQPGYTEAVVAFSSMDMRSKTVEEREQMWQEICRAQIDMWGSQFLREIKSKKTVEARKLANRVGGLLHPSSKILAQQLWEDDNFDRNYTDLIQKLIQEDAMKKMTTPAKHEFLSWTSELNFRRLRCEINQRIKERWRFVLQHVPPPDLALNFPSLHCARRGCPFQYRLMPPGFYCLRLVPLESAEDYDGIKNAREDDEKTPGRNQDGHLRFCLTCVEDLYNGDGHRSEEIGAKERSGLTEQPKGLLWRPSNGRIEAEWTRRRNRAIRANSDQLAYENGVEVEPDKAKISEQVSQQPGACEVSEASNATHQRSPEASSYLPFDNTLLERPAPFHETILNYPLLPEQTSLATAPGLTPFAANLSSFIRAETRSYDRNFFTLDSYEYYALMKWKNIVSRKTMWEIPSNRRFFCTQIPNAMNKYDFVNFFGDDILDEDEPKPRIVSMQILNVEPISADDISSWTTMGTSFGATRTRELKPLSEIMKLVSKRVDEAWALQNPAWRKRYEVPTNGIPSQGQWPPLSFWPDYPASIARKKKREEQLQTIRKNNETISALKERAMRERALEGEVI